MTRAFLGLGSNLGDRRRYLLDAVEALGDQVVAVSSLYETDPVGGPDQESFLNIVVEIDTDLAPRELLGVCHRLESAAERVRIERWGPRTLDVDIVWMDGVTLTEPDLVIPHERMTQRRFVLVPLAELAPDLVSPEQIDRAEGQIARIGPLRPEPTDP